MSDQPAKTPGTSRELVDDIFNCSPELRFKPIDYGRAGALLDAYAAKIAAGAYAAVAERIKTIDRDRGNYSSSWEEGFHDGLVYIAGDILALRTQDAIDAWDKNTKKVRDQALEEAALIADAHWPESGHIHQESSVSCQMTISIQIRRSKIEQGTKND